MTQKHDISHEVWLGPCYNVLGFTGNNQVNSTLERFYSDNPNWREQIRRCQDATTSFTASKESIRALPMLWEVTEVLKPQFGGTTPDVYKIHGYWNVPSYNTGFPGFVLDPNRADETARIALMKKILRERRQLMSGEIVKDLYQTIRLIANPFTLLQRRTRRHVSSLIKDLARLTTRRRGSTRIGRRESLRRLNDFVKDKYLAYTFGVGPLISDINGAVEALRKSSSDVPDRRTFSAIGVEEKTTEASVSVLATSAHNTRQLEAHITTHEFVMVKYRGAISLSSLDFSWARSSGVLPSDFIPTLWECLPWSFLFDYVANVQAVLMGISFPSGDLAWLNRTIVHTVRKGYQLRESAVLIDPSYDFVRSRLLPGQSIRSRKTVVRGSLGLNTYVGFHLRAPSVKQAINMLALREHFWNYVTRISIPK